MSLSQSWLLSWGKGAGPTKYDILVEEGELFHVEGEKYQRPNRFRRVLTRSRIVVCVAVLVSLFVFGAFNADDGPYQDWAPKSAEPTKLHLVVPASHEDVNLCKTLFSSAILGYPSPVLINWNHTFHNPTMFIDLSHIAKIEGVRDYLKSLPESSNDDLVLVVDGYDVWFQLPPNVLIQRYLEVNSRANCRIHSRLGRAMAREQIHQTVVFSSQKKCWPQEEGYNPRCYALPESELSPDVYGPETDVLSADPLDPYRRMRQRYLNSGAVIGPRKQLLAVYERALEKVKSNSKVYSDQGIFADILGDQEYQREVLRLRHRNWADKLRDVIQRFRGTYNSFTESEDADMEPSEGTPYEYGLGVDYASELVQPTVFAEYDTAWLVRSDEAAIEAASSSQKIVPPQVGPLSRDILESSPPFALDAPGLPNAEISWSDVPLFTNLYTGVSPVAVHHNAWRDGLKNRRQTHWNETWFQPYARALLTARVLEPEHPLALIEPLFQAGQDGPPEQTAARYESIGPAHEWVAAGRSPGGAEVFGGEDISWAQLCKGGEDEIFRDQLGPWEDPRQAAEAQADFIER